MLDCLPMVVVSQQATTHTDDRAAMGISCAWEFRIVDYWRRYGDTRASRQLGDR